MQKIIPPNADAISQVDPEHYKEIVATNVERDEKGVIGESKENLTKCRAFEAKDNFMEGNTLYTELEKTYGKYLYVPFDIPKILPNDLEHFVSWYYEHARHSSKQIEDFSSGTFKATDRTYLTVDSVTPRWTPVWTLNPQPDVYTLFPEIFEQIHDYMPWVGEKDFRWNMWSSSAHVPAHRDHSSCVDAPLAMRIKLYDTNPRETLSLLTDPIKEHKNKYIELPTAKAPDTNTFTWNNLRTKHRSLRYPGVKYRKILFIWRDFLRTNQAVNQYVDLMERSIAKYQATPGAIWVDENSAADYLILDQ